MLLTKIATGIALGASLAFAASPALAAGWTIVNVPPTGQNAILLGVSAPSDTTAWAVGNSGGAPNTGLGSHALVDQWNGSAWSQASLPALTGTVSLQAVSASGANDAWAVGSQRPQRYTFDPLALHWNGSAWSTSTSIGTAVPGDTYLVGTADIALRVFGYPVLVGSGYDTADQAVPFQCASSPLAAGVLSPMA